MDRAKSMVEKVKEKLDLLVLPALAFHGKLFLFNAQEYVLGSLVNKAN